MVVRGIYHREGKQDGREYDDFVDAGIIIPESLPRADRGSSLSGCRSKVFYRMMKQFGRACLSRSNPA